MQLAAILIWIAPARHTSSERMVHCQWCKRLTRLTYAFSRSWDNLRAALALHFAYYNLCRIHGSLRITPAMASGITDHVWTLNELINP
jgi:hypothetical protein